MVVRSLLARLPRMRRGTPVAVPTTPASPEGAPAAAFAAGPLPAGGIPHHTRAAAPGLRAGEGQQTVRPFRPAPSQALRRGPAGSAVTGDDPESPAERARRRVQQHVEEAIGAAQQRGAFDNLPGKGKPIPAEHLVAADDAWLAAKTLANAGFLPPWLQLQHDIDADWTACEELVRRTERFPPLANPDRPMTELRQRIAELRDKVRRYNLMVPAMALQRAMPRTEALVQRMTRAVERDHP